MLYYITKLGFSVLLGLLMLWSWDPNQILWSLYYLARDTPWPVGRPWGTDVALRSPTLTSSTQRYTDSQTHIDTQMLKHTLIQILKQTDTQTHRDRQILRYSNTKTHKRTATNTQKHRDTSADTYRLNNIPVSLCIHHNDPPHFVWFRFLPNVSHCDHVPGFVWILFLPNVSLCDRVPCFQQNCKNQLEMARPWFFQPSGCGRLREPFIAFIKAKLWPNNRR